MGGRLGWLGFGTACMHCIDLCCVCSEKSEPHTRSRPTLTLSNLRPAGGISSLARRYRHHRSTDWLQPDPPAAASTPSPSFGRPLYSVYNEASYDVVWETYAYQSNISWWFKQDFGKAGLSGSWTREEAALAVSQLLMICFLYANLPS